MPARFHAATLTLNPALDLTVRAEALRLGEVNRASELQVSAGGKGVNVASFLAQSGFRVAATGLLGQENADEFERHFARLGIEDRFVRIAGAARTSIKLVDAAAQTTTDINLPGPRPAPEALEALLEGIASLAGECGYFALSGSLPPGVDARVYARIISGLKKAGCRALLDTSGEALRQGVKAGPWALKPNLRELEELAGRHLEDEADALEAGRGLLGRGIEHVIVSMGERGAWFIRQGRAVLARPPRVGEIRSTVAAGDALAAGVVAAGLRGLGLEETARMATAWAAGKLAYHSARLPGEAELAALAQQVELTEVY